MKKALLAILLVTMLAVSANAALITLSSEKTGSTTYQVTALVTEGSFGLASFGLQLKPGTYSTISNQSPKIVFSDSTGTLADVSCGFTLLRAANATTGVATGSQDTIAYADGASVMAFGIGQTAGNLATLIPSSLGYDTTGSAIRANYAVPVVLLTGNTAAGAAAPILQVAGQDMVPGTRYLAATQSGTFGNIFTADTGAVTAAADIMLVPEPATIGLLILGLGLLRRKH